jgi:hypothetical protein
MRQENTELVHGAGSIKRAEKAVLLCQFGQEQISRKVKGKKESRE